MADAQLDQVRNFALCLPETDEAAPFGDPWFRVRSRMFCCFSKHQGKPSLIVKVGKGNLDLFLRDARFFKSPYIGNAGWVGLVLEDPLQPEEVRTLIRDSYNHVAPKSLRLPLEE